MKVISISYITNTTTATNTCTYYIYIYSYYRLMEQSKASKGDVPNSTTESYFFLLCYTEFNKN